MADTRMNIDVDVLVKPNKIDDTAIKEAMAAEAQRLSEYAERSVLDLRQRVNITPQLDARSSQAELDKMKAWLSKRGQKIQKELAPYLTEWEAGIKRARRSQARPIASEDLLGFAARDKLILERRIAKQKAILAPLLKEQKSLQAAIQGVQGDLGGAGERLQVLQAEIAAKREQTQAGIERAKTARALRAAQAGVATPKEKKVVRDAYLKRQDAYLTKELSKFGLAVDNLQAEKLPRSADFKGMLKSLADKRKALSDKLKGPVSSQQDVELRSGLQALDTMQAILSERMTQLRKPTLGMSATKKLETSVNALARASSRQGARKFADMSATDQAYVKRNLSRASSLAFSATEALHTSAAPGTPEAQDFQKAEALLKQAQEHQNRIKREAQVRKEGGLAGLKGTEAAVQKGAATPIPAGYFQNRDKYATKIEELLAKRDVSEREAAKAVAKKEAADNRKRVESLAKQRVKESTAGFKGREEVVSQTVQGRNAAEVRTLTDQAVNEERATPIDQRLRTANTAIAHASRQRQSGNLQGVVDSLKTAESKLKAYEKTLSNLDTRAGIEQRVAALKARRTALEGALLKQEERIKAAADAGPQPQSRTERERAERNEEARQKQREKLVEQRDTNRRARDTLHNAGGDWERAYRNNPEMADDLKSYGQWQRKTLNKRRARLVNEGALDGTGGAKVESEFRSTANQLSANTANLKALTEAARSAHPAWSRLGHAVRSFATYGMVYAGGFTLLNKIIQGTQAVLEFQQALKGVQAISQATDADMVRIAAGIKEVGTSSKFSIAELTKATQLLAQAGVTPAEIPTTLKQVEQFSSATSTPVEVSADLLTSMRNIFRGTPDKVLTDQLTSAVNISKLQGEDLKTIISLAGQQAKAYNISSDQFLAFTSMLSQVGVKPSTIATGTRQSLLEILNPDKKTLSKFQELYKGKGEAYDAGSVRKRLGSLQFEADPLMAMISELERLGVDSENKDKFRRATDIRAENIILAALGNKDIYEGFLGEIPQAGSAAEGARTQMEGFIASMQALGNSFVELGANATSDLLPALTTAAKWMGESVKSLSSGETFRLRRPEMTPEQRVEEDKAKAGPLGWAVDLRDKFFPVPEIGSRTQEENARRRQELESSASEFATYDPQAEFGVTQAAESRLQQVETTRDPVKLDQQFRYLEGRRKAMIEGALRASERKASGEATPYDEAVLTEMRKVQDTNFFKGVRPDFSNIEGAQRELVEQYRTLLSFGQGMWADFGEKAKLEVEQFVSQVKEFDAKTDVSQIANDLERGRYRIADLVTKGDAESIKKIREALIAAMEKAKVGAPALVPNLQTEIDLATQALPYAEARGRYSQERLERIKSQKAAQMEKAGLPEEAAPEQLQQADEYMQQMLQNNKLGQQNAQAKGDTKRLNALIAEEAQIETGLAKNKLQLAIATNKNVELARQEYKATLESINLRNQRNQQEKVIGTDLKTINSKLTEQERYKAKLETQYQQRAQDVLQARAARSEAYRSAKSDEVFFKGLSAQVAGTYKPLKPKEELDLMVKNARVMSQGGEWDALKEQARTMGGKVLEMAQAGQIGDWDAKGYVSQAQQFSREANDALKAKANEKVRIEEARLQQTINNYNLTAKRIEDLHKKAEQLQALKVNFDQEHAQKAADNLLKGIQEKFLTQPIKIQTEFEPPKNNPEKEPTGVAPVAPKKGAALADLSQGEKPPSNGKVPPSEPVEPTTDELMKRWGEPKSEVKPATVEAAPEGAAQSRLSEEVDDSHLLGQAGSALLDAASAVLGVGEAQADEQPQGPVVLVDKRGEASPTINVAATPPEVVVEAPPLANALAPVVEPTINVATTPPEIAVEAPAAPAPAPTAAGGESEAPGQVLWDHEDLGVTPDSGPNFTAGMFLQALGSNLSEIPRIVQELAGALVEFPEMMGKLASEVPQLAAALSQPDAGDKAMGMAKQAGSKAMEVAEGIIPSPDQPPEQLVSNLVNLLMPMGAAREASTFGQVVKPNVVGLLGKGAALTDDTPAVLDKVFTPERVTGLKQFVEHMNELFGPDSFRETMGITPQSLGINPKELEALSNPLGGFTRLMKRSAGLLSDRGEGYGLANSGEWKAYLNDLFGPESFRAAKLTPEELADPAIQRALAVIDQPIEALKGAVKSITPNLSGMKLWSTPVEADMSTAARVTLTSDDMRSLIEEAIAARGSLHGDDVRGLLKEAIGSPKLREAPDEALSAALEMRRSLNTQKGLDPDITTGALRDEIARRDAITRGLPENNTAADRAKALGRTETAYHGTAADVPAFNDSKYRGSTTSAKSAKIADWATDNHRVAESYTDIAANRVDTPAKFQAEKALNEAENARLAFRDEYHDIFASNNYNIAAPNFPPELRARYLELSRAAQNAGKNLEEERRLSGQNIIPLQVEDATPVNVEEYLQSLEAQLENSREEWKAAQTLAESYQPGNYAPLQDAYREQNKLNLERRAPTSVATGIEGVDTHDEQYALLSDRIAKLTAEAETKYGEAVAAGVVARKKAFDIRNQQVKAGMYGVKSHYDAKGASYGDVPGGLTSTIQSAPPGTRVFRFDDLVDPGEPATHYALLKPGTARSRFAAHDMSRADEANLLASNPTGINKLGMAEGATQQQSEESHRPSVTLPVEQQSDLPQIADTPQAFETVEVAAPKVEVTQPDQPETVRVEAPKVEVTQPDQPETVRVEAPKVEVTQPDTLDPLTTADDEPRGKTASYGRSKPDNLTQVSRQDEEGRAVSHKSLHRRTLAESNAAFDAIDAAYSQPEPMESFLPPDWVGQTNSFARNQKHSYTKEDLPRVNDSLGAGAASEQHSEDYKAGAARSLVDGKWVDYQRAPEGERERILQHAQRDLDIEKMKRLVDPLLLPEGKQYAADGGVVTPSNPPLIEGLRKIHLPRSAFEKPETSFDKIVAKDTATQNAQNMAINNSTPVNLTVPGIGTFPMEAEQDVIGTMVAAFNTAAAKLGGR